MAPTIQSLEAGIERELVQVPNRRRARVCMALVPAGAVAQRDPRAGAVRVIQLARRLIEGTGSSGEPNALAVQSVVVANLLHPGRERAVRQGVRRAGVGELIAVAAINR